MDVNAAIQMAVAQMQKTVQTVSGQLGEPRKALSQGEQVRRYREMTPTQRFQIKERVGEEEYVRYEDTMRQLIAQGL